MNSTNPRILSGVVISDKADKTITVKIERKVKHPYIERSWREQLKFMLMMKTIVL